MGIISKPSLKYFILNFKNKRNYHLQAKLLSPEKEFRQIYLILLHFFILLHTYIVSVYGSLFPSCCETNRSFAISVVFCCDYCTLPLETFQKQSTPVVEKGFLKNCTSCFRFLLAIVTLLLFSQPLLKTKDTINQKRKYTQV